MRLYEPSMHLYKMFYSETWSFTNLLARFCFTRIFLQLGPKLESSCHICNVELALICMRYYSSDCLLDMVLDRRSGISWPQPCRSCRSQLQFEPADYSALDLGITKPCMIASHAVTCSAFFEFFLSLLSFLFNFLIFALTLAIKPVKDA